MKVILLSIKFRHSHHYTLIETLHTPTWLERFFLVARKRKVWYLGHKTVWWFHPSMKPVTDRAVLAELAALELKGKYIKSQLQ